MHVDKELFGPGVYRYTLVRPGGITVRILDRGGVIQSLEAPDRAGRRADVVLGHPDLDGYLATRDYFGAIVGRYANRIAGGTFVLDGAVHRLPLNEGKHSLHGGPAGFDTHVWSAVEIHDADSVGVRLTHVSPDGDQGYPGTVTAEVTYRLDTENRLSITYRATTDAPTVLNLTNHTYWNLAGGGDVLGHRLAINASRFSPVDEALIPVGGPVPVEGTPFDFRHATEIGARLGADDAQLRFGHGYDHNWVLDHPAGLSFAAQALDPGSGRLLTMWTTEPGLQFYSGAGLADPAAGFALEAQHFPDSPNRPDFPSTVLRPGETYHQETVYELGIG